MFWTSHTFPEQGFGKQARPSQQSPVAPYPQLSPSFRPTHVSSGSISSTFGPQSKILIRVSRPGRMSAGRRAATVGMILTPLAHSFLLPPVILAPPSNAFITVEIVELLTPFSINIFFDIVRWGFLGRHRDRHLEFFETAFGQSFSRLVWTTACEALGVSNTDCCR